MIWKSWSTSPPAKEHGTSHLKVYNMIFLPTTGAFTRLKGTFLETSQDSQNNHFSILEVGENMHHRSSRSFLVGLFCIQVWTQIVLRPKLEVFHKLGWIKDYQTRSLHVPSLRTNISPENGWLEVGRLVSCWDGPFSWAMLVLGISFGPNLKDCFCQTFKDRNHAPKQKVVVGWDSWLLV